MNKTSYNNLYETRYCSRDCMNTCYNNETTTCSCLIKNGNSQFFLRNKGKKVSFDLVIKDGKLIKSLLDLGLDFTEYHKFNFEFSLGIKVSELFNEWEDPALNLIKMMSILFSIQSETENCRYLLIALSEALKDVKINDKEIQK